MANHWRRWGILRPGAKHEICARLRPFLQGPCTRVTSYTAYPYMYMYLRSIMSPMQWRAEGLGCPGPTRFLDAHK